MPNNNIIKELIYNVKPFIRLDMKDHWRGKEHRSSMLGLGDEFEELFHDGISCYNLNDPAWAIDRLRWYWTEVATMTRPEDYTNMQVTIFEGEELDKLGADGENIAICKRTILETEAESFMKRVLELYDLYYYEEELTEEEYYQELEKLFKEMLNV